MAAKQESTKYAYKFTGDGPKIFRGTLVRPGDPIETDEEVINGYFEPQNAIAKAAKAATDKANDEAPAIAQAERLAAMGGSLAFPEVAGDFTAPDTATKSAASAAPPEA